MSCPLMEYAEKMYSPREWGGQIEIEAMSLMYKWVHQLPIILTLH